MTHTKSRILALAHSPFVGGGELALKSLIDSTSHLYDWTVVIPHSENIDEKIKSPGVRYVSLPALTWWCYEAHDKPTLINQRRLKASLGTLESLAKDADILLTNTITIPWLGFIAQKNMQPHIWYVHEYGDIDHNLQFIAGYEQSLKMINQSSSRVLTISNDVKQHLSRIIPAEKIDLIHQSIDLNDLVNIPVASHFDTFSILCMGAIKPSKGQLIALDAVSKLKNVSLDIIGPSADQAYAQLLQKRAESFPNISVQVRRYSPKDELSSHNVLLMCSENEGLGRVTLEGLAAGRLVIGYDCRSTRELLDSQRGILYSPNNAASLQKTIETLNENLSRVNLEQARRYVMDTFSSESQAHDFENCVQNALSVPPPEGTLMKEYIQLLRQSNLWERPLETIKRTVKNSVPKPIKRTVKKLLSK